MEHVGLSNPQARTLFFKQCIHNNLYYWYTWVKKNSADIPAMDHERNNIVKAITFALRMQDVDWPTARALVELFSPYIEKRGFWDNWNGILKQAIAVAQRLEDTPGEVNLSALLTRLLFRQGRVREATQYSRRIARLARRIGDLFNEARVYTNLGYYYAEYGQLYRSEVLCYYALKLFEQINNDHGQAHTHNHLGVLFDLKQCWDTALNHLLRACDIWQKTGDNHGLMFGYINLGTLYTTRQQPDQALQYLEQAHNLAKLTGDETSLGMIYVNKGFAYKKKGDYVQAEHFAKQAELIFRPMANFQELARLWDNLGMACLYQGKHNEAKVHLEASLEMWRKLDNKGSEINTLIDIVEYELVTGNQPQARVIFSKAEALLEQYHHHKALPHLQSILREYRRRLTN
ncbi:MAG: tetratricopeptide repeat protein [Anaerolineae bacterium]|nr:tetratricopeptide repeat protein [Anaerolineae bacterium]